MTLRDLSNKDVIQLKTGENLGRIDDIVFDERGARLQSVILRGRAHCFGLLGCDDDLILPWVKYGKSLDYHGFQKSVMLIAESKYVVALIINGQLQKAEEYIKNEWEGKREGRSWQQVMTNLELSKKYQEKDAAGYSATLEKAGKVFQKNPLFMAKNLMLKG